MQTKLAMHVVDQALCTGKCANGQYPVLIFIQRVGVVPAQFYNEWICTGDAQRESVQDTKAIPNA